MPTQINCPNCGVSLSLPDAAVGKRVKCTKCSTPFVAPAAPSPEATIRPPVAATPAEPTPAPPVSPQPAAVTQSAPSPAMSSAGEGQTKASVFSVARIREEFAATVDDIKAKKPTRRVLIAGGATLLLLVLIGGLFGGALGIGGTRSVDIREVVVNPREYAGQKLRSEAIMEGYFAYRGIGSVGSVPLMLHVPAELEDKAISVDTSTGEFDYVIVEYRIWRKDEFEDISRWEARFNELDKELSRERKSLQADHDAIVGERMSGSEIEKLFYAKEEENQAWESEELRKLFDAYKSHGWREFQFNRIQADRYSIPAAFTKALRNLENRRQYDTEEDSPEYRTLTAEIELCMKLQAEYEEAFEEIQATLAERREDNPRELFREQYAAEDRAARERMELFEDKARQRHEELRREADGYFNEEYGHDYSGSHTAGVLLDVNIP